MNPPRPIFTSSALAGLWRPRAAMPRVLTRSVSHRRRKRPAGSLNRRRSILPPMRGFLIVLAFLILAAASITLATA